MRLGALAWIAAEVIGGGPPLVHPSLRREEALYDVAAEADRQQRAEARRIRRAIRRADNVTRSVANNYRR